MTLPRRTVPCPRCGATTPAGVPRHATLLAVVETPRDREEFDVDDPRHIEARCPHGHDVYVYYERHFTDPPDSIGPE